MNWLRISLSNPWANLAIDQLIKQFINACISDSRRDCLLNWFGHIWGSSFVWQTNGFDIWGVQWRILLDRGWPSNVQPSLWKQKRAGGNRKGTRIALSESWRMWAGKTKRIELTAKPCDKLYYSVLSFWWKSWATRNNWTCEVICNRPKRFNCIQRITSQYCYEPKAFQNEDTSLRIRTFMRHAF